MDDTKYWLWLSLVFGNSNRRLWQIMSAFETASEAYYELCDGGEMFALTSREKDSIKSTRLHHAEEIIDCCLKKGVKITGYSSEKYPARIRYICNPPAVLYYKGNIDCLCGTKAVTVVGTRKASAYSLYAVDRICSELAEKDVIIVSGFAVGTDIKSHLSAVSRKKPTVCVLGCGIDVNYPNENFHCRDMILESGGVFISEFNMGTRPFGSNFPRRNRILSALGNATVVFQASLASGSLITANLSAEQGREVFCLPPLDIFSYDYSGNTELIRSGAIPLFSANDILVYLDLELPAIPDEWAEKAGKKSSKTHIAGKIQEKTAGTDKDSTEGSYGLHEFEGIQNDIMRLLSDGAVHADIIADTLNLNTTELMTELTELEMAGAVNSLPGKMFEIKVKE